MGTLQCANSQNQSDNEKQAFLYLLDTRLRTPCVCMFLHLCYLRLYADTNADSNARQTARYAI